MMTLVKQYDGKYRAVSMYYNEETGCYRIYYNMIGFEIPKKEKAMEKFEECKRDCIRFDEIMEEK